MIIHNNKADIYLGTNSNMFQDAQKYPHIRTEKRVIKSVLCTQPQGEKNMQDNEKRMNIADSERRMNIEGMKKDH